MPDFHGYHPWYSGFEGNNHAGGEWRDAYHREIPQHYQGEGVESFTKKMLTDFAIEGTDEDTHKPNGKFYLTKDKAKAATYEVLDTHLGLKGAAADDHLSKYFDAVWNHVDVNETGKVDAIEMNKFMRDLCKPLKEHIDL